MSFFSRRSVWFVALPIAIGLAYWLGLHALAFTDGSWIRIPALPKVFFDQTMYLEVMAKDIIHGFHILPLPVRPLVALARVAWPAVSLSEFYVVGIMLSAILSLWFFAVLVQRMGNMTVVDARIRSVIAFLLVQSILVLRPGAPSWYVPFFLAAMLLVWIGEGLWTHAPLRAAASWAFAILLATVYPWYFASIVAVIGMLFLLRWVRGRMVVPGVAVGILVAWIVIGFRHAIVQKALSSYAVMLAYYGGIQFSHLTTVSNTVVLMVAWVMLWLPRAVRDARVDNRTSSSVALMMLAAWVGQMVLWLQSVLTGLSIVPDHFIYSVWIFSAISWAVWAPDAHETSRERLMRTGIGAVAAIYICSVLIRIPLGIFRWVDYPSLIIHVGVWTFLALAALPLSKKRMIIAALLVGVVSAWLGVAAVRASAVARADVDLELDGVRQWIMKNGPQTDTRWCSDTLAADYLYSTTGYAMYPTFSDKHDPISIERLQNRLVEVSAFYSPRLGGDLFIWDDMILHDLDFPCRVFQPGITVVDKLPSSRETKNFINGCDQSWADAERARVIARMDTAWSSPVPTSSALCDRFVVRKRLKEDWRIPASYGLLYEDAKAAVYGTH